MHCISFDRSRWKLKSNLNRRNRLNAFLLLPAQHNTIIIFVFATFLFVHYLILLLLFTDTKNSVGLVGCIEEVSHNAIAVYWNPLESSAKVRFKWSLDYAYIIFPFRKEKKEECKPHLICISGKLQTEIERRSKKIVWNFILQKSFASINSQEYSKSWNWSADECNVSL